MPRTVRSLARAALVLAVLAAGPARAEPEPCGVCSRDGWCWRQPTPVPHTLRAVWGSSPRNVFAVGDRGTILHFDGAAWRGMASGTTLDLAAVWGAAPDDVYAAGGLDSGPERRGVLLHWDGRAWSPVGPERLPPLVAVGGTGPADVVAAARQEEIATFDGKAWKLGRSQPGFWHWAVRGGPDGALYLGGTGVLRREGGGWRPVAPKAFQSYGQALGGAGGELWALGSSGAARFDGTRWEAKGALGVAQPRALWAAAPGDVWVVGEGGRAAHLSGGKWQEAALPSRAALHGLWGGGGQLFAVGERGAVLRHDGEAWRALSRDATGGALAGIWDGAAGMHVFGDDGLLRLGAGGLEPVGERRALLAVAGEAKPELAIVRESDESRIVCPGRDGSLRPRGSFRPRGLWVWEEAEPAVVAVGESFPGTYQVPGIAAFDSAECGTEPRTVRLADAEGRPVRSDFHAIWGLPGADGNSGEAFAVGAGGTIARQLPETDGEWQLLKSPVTTRLDAVWGRGPKEVYAAGEGGVVLRWDGAAWTALPPVPGAPALAGVWAAGPKEVYVVGAAGLVARFDGAGWRRLDAGTDARLRAVRGRGPEDVWIVGDGGVVLQYRGPRCAAP